MEPEKENSHLKSSGQGFIFLVMIGTAKEFPCIAEKSIPVDGINIAYKDEGNRQIILCIHALGHSSKDFASL